ncbi:MAG TPA: helix-turn-helix domain-containing GNAT family N-acetyltransferase [Steroidobacteraceae bacterium]|jgi:DNA-binding MarR family transcriptional regulator/GNAT superfamily N-acetyltransferase|nr:helix-turn-helix domain-containing GNAT family N-acetyltransferase [Steroidobacteraceae bacterium]
MTDHVETIRAFNRFYTRQIGLLEESLLDSGFTLTECRVLYELAHRTAPTAAQIGNALGLDAGYLSRILAKFEQRKLVRRTDSKQDVRAAHVGLTAAGRKAFAPINAAAREHIDGLLKPLGAGDVGALTDAMGVVRRVLGDSRAEPNAYQLRDLEVGDVGWIVHRQAMLYTREYGWDTTYEALVADILSGFIKSFDAQRERSWIAERDGQIIGSVFVMRESDDVAKLRLLYVEPSARGLGVGRHLVDECIRFARAKGYKKLTLWTNDCLTAARKIYLAAGFKLVKEKKHHSFGKDLVGQTWDLDLRSPAS